MNAPSHRSIRSGALGVLVLGLGAGTASAALQSGVYQTVPGGTVLEFGDRVPGGSRTVPCFATLKFDLSGSPPSLAAMLTNAVLEGGAPFTLTVRSASGSAMSSNVWRFQGDYLRDLYPTGTQYAFDWRFSITNDNRRVWNGYTYWAGGHLWEVTISNLAIVPVPWLGISPARAGSVQISWATNFADYVLEYASEVPAVNWTTVTNTIGSTNDVLSVTLDAAGSPRLYRLHRP